MRFMRRASTPSFCTRLTSFFAFHFFREQIRVADDAGERIVQFVRDAGDELSERGQFFRAHQLMMQARIFDGDGEVGSEHFEFHDFGGVNRRRCAGSDEPPRHKQPSWHLARKSAGSARSFPARGRALRIRR